MARKYVVQKRDTLTKIAKHFYGDPAFSKKLADYNGILRPDLILVGQTIEIPSRRELEEVMPGPHGFPELAPPNGLDQIITTFGNIYEFVREDGNLDPRWESEQLGRAPLPFPIPLSWDHSKFVRSVYCHLELTELVSEIFATIEREGLENRIQTYGGCFSFRSKRTSAKLSTHSWGIALDLNPETNLQGKAGDMDPDVVEVFCRFGFKWGGDWPGTSKDPMHFQFCTGY